MRVFIADALPRVRYALRVLMQKQPGTEVVGEAATAQELLARVATTGSDVLLLDWRLVGPEPQELLDRLRQLRPGITVVALSEWREDRSVAESAGADGFACKCDAAAGLLAAIASCAGAGTTH